MLKKLYNRLTILIAIVLMIFVVAADAQDGELTEWQLYLIVFVIAPILTEVWKLILNAAQDKYKVGKIHASVMVTVFAVILSYLFGDQMLGNLPPVGDNFILWLDALLDAVVGLLGLATIIYNLLWDRVFDGLALGEINFVLFKIRLRPTRVLSYRLK